MAARPVHFHRDLLDNLYDGVYFADKGRRITYWNKAAHKLTGYGPEEVLGRRCRDNILNHVDDRGTSLCRSSCPLIETIKSGRPTEVEVYLHHKDGHRVPVLVRTAPVFDRNGRVTGAVEVFNDNSSRLEARERLKELERLALLDHLTNLPNRRYVESQLQARLAEVQRFGWLFGVLFVDIDHFKQVNDSHGHDTGDEVLRMVARTLEASSRPFDLVGRWGGEEFLVIVRNVEAEALRQTAERYRLLVRESVLFRKPEPIRVTVSIGGSLALETDTVETLVHRVDQCLYQSKSQGRDRVTCA